MTERNPLWHPISPPAPRVTETVLSYRMACPVRVNLSQRYSLSLTEPCPEPVWRKS